jgi:hypothetical protein
MARTAGEQLPPGWGRVLANLADRDFCARLFDMPLVKQPGDALAGVPVTKTRPDGPMVVRSDFLRCELWPGCTGDDVEAMAKELHALLEWTDQQSRQRAAPIAPALIAPEQGKGNEEDEQTAK